MEVRKVLHILFWIAVCYAVMWCAFAAYAFTPEQQEPQEFFAKVARHDTFDFRGIQFYELRFSDGSAATISIDPDVPLSAALKALDGQRVRVTLEPATLVLKKVEREK